MEGHEDPQRGSPGRQRRSEAAVISDGLLSELVLIPGVKTNIFRELPFSVVPLQKGLHQQESSKLPSCPKGLCALENQGAKLMRRVSQTFSRGGDRKSCRWPGMGISYLEEAPVHHVCRNTAAIKPSVSHQQDGFHKAFMHFVMTTCFVAIYFPAGLSSLFISCGSHCTAVNHCKADSLVSSHKFKCWKKRFVYSYASVL